MSIPLVLLSFALSASDASTPPSRLSDAPRASDDARDGELLRALLFAFAPAPTEIRLLAIENLSLLGDPRALDPLASLFFDPDPRIAAAAVRAAGSFPGPAAEQLLATVLRGARTNDVLKLAALERLVFHRSPSARALIAEAASGLGVSNAVQWSARDALLRWGPLPAPTHSPPKTP